MSRADRQSAVRCHAYLATLAMDRGAVAIEQALVHAHEVERHRDRAGEAALAIRRRDYHAPVRLEDAQDFQIIENSAMLAAISRARLCVAVAIISAFDVDREADPDEPAVQEEVALLRGALRLISRNFTGSSEELVRRTLVWVSDPYDDADEEEDDRCDADLSWHIEDVDAALRAVAGQIHLAAAGCRKKYQLP